MRVYNYNLIIKYFIEICSEKFVNLNSNWADLNNFYANKKLLTTVVGTNKTCFGGYSIFKDDRKNYTYFWLPNQNFSQVYSISSLNKNISSLNNNTIASSNNISNSTNSSLNSFQQLSDIPVLTDSMRNLINSYPNLSSSFQFTKSKYLKDSGYSGLFADYLSGGYVYRMAGDLSTVTNSLSALQKMNWIDQRTRAIFFDFTLYNPNVDLYAYCSFSFEILPSGTIIPFANIRIMNMWSTSREVLATGCMAAYLVVIGVLMAKEIKSYLSMRKAYFKQFWVYVDWTLFACSWTALPMYLYKIYALHSLLSDVAENHISYINLSNMVSWNSTLSYFLSFITFIATIKLIRLLRFNKKLSYLTNTIKRCTSDLTSFSVCFMVLYIAFVQLMFIIYNDRTLGYATFNKAMATNFLIILGKFDLRPFLSQNYAVGALIFAVYSIVIVMIMINVLVTIISDHFSKSRIEAKKIKEASMFDHLQKKIKEVLPSKNNRIDLYSAKSGVNYSDYVEHINSFEIKTKKLVDNLKMKIEKGMDEARKFDAI